MAALNMPQPVRLVSFAVFGTKELYTEGAVANAVLLPQIYPGWTGRFYLADDVPNSTVTKLDQMPHVEVVLFSRKVWPGRAAQLLRFLPASEKGVDAVIVRDSDSRVNLREAACVAEWLANTPVAQFHIMHESMHNAQYGEIMGGMWGARCCNDNISSGCPVPCLADAVSAFRTQGPSPEKGAEYGGDMAFLSGFLVPLLSAGNCVHHLDGDAGRSLGSLSLPRRRFPETSYLGFVGQPVNCPCPPAHFASTGCCHVHRSVSGELASRVGCNPDVLAALGQFLG